MSHDPTQRDGPAIRPAASEVPHWQRAAKSSGAAQRARNSEPATPKEALNGLLAWRPAPLALHHRGRAYWGAHWRGELDLARSFWLNHVLAVWPAATALTAWMGCLAVRGEGLRVGALGQLLGWPMLLVLLIWSVVGLWRAAGAIDAPAGAWAARAVSGLALLQTLISFALGALPQVPNWGGLLAGREPLGNIEMTRSEDGTRLQLRGPIGLGDAERLRQMLADSPDLRSLELAATGTRCAEAQGMARLVRERKLETRAVGICAEACVGLFLSGIQRQLAPGSALHLSLPVSHTYHPLIRNWLQASERQSLSKLGLSPLMLERAQRASPRRAWSVPVEELLAQGLVSPLPQTLELSLPQGRGASLAAFNEALALHPVWLALEARWPGVSAELAGQLHAARATGASDEALHALSWPLLAPRMPGLLRGVDPVLRRRYVQLVAEQLKALSDGPGCRDLLEGRLAVRLQLPVALRVDEAGWLMDAAAALPDRLTERSVKVIELEVVHRAVGAGAPGLLAGLWGTAKAGVDCASAIKLIGLAASRTPAQRELTERLMFAAP